MTNTQSPAPGVAAEATVQHLMQLAKRLQGYAQLTEEQSDSDVAAFEDELRTALQASAAAVPVAIGEGFFLPDGSWTGSASRTPGYLRMVEGDEANGCTIRPIYAGAPPLPAQVRAAEVTTQQLLDIIEAVPDIGDKTARELTIARMAARLASISPAPEVVPDAAAEEAFWRKYPNIKRVAEQLASRTPAPGMAGGVGADTEWLKFDIENPPTEGLYWVRSEAPEVDVDVDDYGQTVGRYTGDSEYSTALVVFNGVTDSRPDFEVLDKWNSGDLSSEGWVTHYLPVVKPTFPGTVVAAAPHPLPAPQAAGADDLRALGLTVAVHNDYHLNGQAFTFWLLTDTVAGKFYKGEGKTDAEALDKIRAAITASGRAGS